MTLSDAARAPLRRRIAVRSSRHCTIPKTVYLNLSAAIGSTLNGPMPTKLQATRPVTTAATYSTSKASRAAVVTAFALVYAVWGSTYLAIRIAVETIPALLMVGTRCLVAGLLLYAWRRYRGERSPSLRDWRTAAVVGTCLLFAGNGGLTYSEQYISSSLAAVLVGAVPIFTALLSWASGVRARPRPLVWLGIAVASAGVVVIVIPGLAASASHHNVVGVTILIAGALVWSIGSIYGSGVRQERSPFMMSGMQMICASVLLIATALVTGEGRRLHPATITGASATAMLYLIFAGSIVGFTAYAWLLRNVEPTHVATHAYVNPVVAILLGHLLAHEELTFTLLVGSGFVIAGVALIVTFRPANRKSGSVKRPDASRPLCLDIAPVEG